MKKILVVDDELDIAETLRAILETQGYEVDSAADGVEALEKLPKSNPELILLDVMMPRMNGYETLRELRSRRGKDFPIILMSAAAPRPVGTDVRWHAFIRKPFDLDTLINTIERLIGVAAA